MKKPFLLFAIKCSVILYFAACTRIENYTADKSATPIVTEGTWIINQYSAASNDKTKEFAGYTFTFNSGGNMIAKKNGVYTTGNWSEDDIDKKIVISLPSTDPLLLQLNQDWKITRITDGKINLEQPGDASRSTLSITTL